LENFTFQNLKIISYTSRLELLVEPMGPLALFGVEVLGFVKTLEEVPGVFVVMDGVKS